MGRSIAKVTSRRSARRHMVRASVKPGGQFGAAGHDEIFQWRELGNGRVDLHLQSRNHCFVERRQRVAMRADNFRVATGANRAMNRSF